MKKAKNLVFIPLIMSLLFACSTREVDIYCPTIKINEQFDQNYDYKEVDLKKYVVDINCDYLIDLMNAKEDFVFYFYNYFCDTCQSIKPNLIRYILDTKTTIYGMDIANDDVFFDLTVKYPSIISQDGITLFEDQEGRFNYSTPLFYIFKNGELYTKQFVTNNMFNYRYFKRVMEKYIINSPVAFSLNLEDIKNYKYVYYFNNDCQNSVNIYKYLLTQEIDNLIVLRNDMFDVEYSNTIINQETKNLLSITSESTISSVCDFLNIPVK